MLGDPRSAPPLAPPPLRAPLVDDDGDGPPRGKRLAEGLDQPRVAIHDNPLVWLHLPRRRHGACVRAHWGSAPVQRFPWRAARPALLATPRTQ